VRTVALARLILGGEMNLQAPPNLSPAAHARLIRAGINDWGGISPLTMDYVNPEAPWPHVAQLRETCRAEGFVLRPRLPIYPEYVDDEFVDPAMRSVIERATDETAGRDEPAGAMA
jgi:FO synthase